MYPAQFADHDGPLSPEARDLYARICAGQAQRPEDAVALAELLTAGLVDVDHEHAPDRPVPLDPRSVMDRRARRELAAIRDQAARAAELPCIADELALHFDRSRRTTGGSEYLAERAAVNARIGDVVAQARQEILAAQPGGPRTRTALDYAIERDTRALERGIRMRSLYRETVRTDALTREWVTTMTKLGGSFATLPAPFQRVIVVDRRQAFIADYVTADGPEHAAWHVTDRAAVAFIADSFEHAWRSANPWAGDISTTGPGMPVGTRTTRLQREIMRDTAAGIDQKRTARRLGIGLRTVTKEISALRDLFGVATLAELTYRWALSPDRAIDDRGAGLEDGPQVAAEGGSVAA